MKAETPDEARALVQKYKENNFEQIKIYASLKPELVKVVTEEAHRLGMTVTGHVPGGMNIFTAIENGFDQINHVGFTYRATLPRDFKPTPGQQPPIEPESETARENLRFLRERGTVIEPTLARTELNLNIHGKPFSAFEPSVAKLPFEFANLINSMGVLPELEARAKAAYQLTLRMTNALHEAGIPLIVGTDLAIPGHTQHREMELMVKAGISPLEAVKAATIVPAKALNLDKELGTIETGKRADFVLVDGNPLEQISEIRKVRFTAKDGRIYEPAPLWRSVGFTL